MAAHQVEQMLFSRTEAALISVSGRATSMRFLGGDFITSFESTGSACESCLTVEFLFEIRKQYIFNHKYDLLRSTMKFEWAKPNGKAISRSTGLIFVRQFGCLTYVRSNFNTAPEPNCGPGRPALWRVAC